MISKETVRKMLENRACDGVKCTSCPSLMMFGISKRCCEKNADGAKAAINGHKFRPRVIRLLTEWLAEQEKENGEK